MAAGVASAARWRHGDGGMAAISQKKKKKKKKKQPQLAKNKKTLSLAKERVAKIISNNINVSISNIISLVA